MAFIMGAIMIPGTKYENNRFREKILVWLDERKPLLGIIGAAMVVWLAYSCLFSNSRRIDNVFDEIYWANLDQAAQSVPFYSTLPTKTDEELFPFT